MNRHLNRFFELSLDMFCIISKDGHFKWVNPAFEKTLGWPENQLLGKPFRTFLHPEDIPSYNDAFKKLTSDIPVITLQNRYRGNDGSYKHLSWTIYPDRKTDLFYAFSQDKTEERRVEELFRLAIEASPSGILVVNEAGVITLSNAQAERYFGYARHEIIDRSVDELVPMANGAHHADYRAKFLSNPEARPMGGGRDLYALRKDGQKFPVEIGLRPIHTQDGDFTLAVIVDITERKKSELLLLQAKEEAEKANLLKSEFLNLMSHELRTPLTVMLGNLPLLTTPNDLPDNEEIAEIAQDIEDSGNHLLTLINDLLDISKIEAGHLQLNIESISVKDLVTNIFSIVKTLADRKGLTLISDVDNCVISADLVRMKQILLNLLSNAIKFTEHGNISLKARNEGENVVFEVKDTGIGMHKESLPLLFNMFHQVDASSTRKAKGSGLGLVITKKLVELHSGKISVESVLNEGSTFRFTIPQ